MQLLPLPVICFFGCHVHFTLSMHFGRYKTIFRHVEYKNNKDYYRGKVKSVYEKEPLFKDFVRNIPLSEMNFYENRNLSTLKKRFNFLVQTKHGLDMNENYDPFSTSGVSQR